MKNLKIIILLITLIIFTSCSDKENDLENVENNKTINVGNSKENENKIENEVYNEIADEKEGLKNATSDDLDKILLEEIRILNTPVSNYIFFEQGSTKKASIEEIKKSGGMEITRGQIYLNGINKEYSFLNDILTDNEKLYSFNQENNENTFFYLDKSENDFLTKIKNKYSDYKLVSSNKEFKEISFKNETKEYMLQMSLPIGASRGDMDNILQTTEKIRVTIVLSK